MKKAKFHEHFFTRKKPQGAGASPMARRVRHHGWNMPGARGEPDKRTVLTAMELPKLGDGEAKEIDVVVDGE